MLSTQSVHSQPTRALTVLPLKPAETNRGERQKRFRERQRAKGMIELRIYVPEKRAEEIKKFTQRFGRGNWFTRMGMSSAHRVFLVLQGLATMGLLIAMAALGGLLVGAIGATAASVRMAGEQDRVIVDLKAALKQERQKSSTAHASLEQSRREWDTRQTAVGYLSRDLKDMRTLMRELRALTVASSSATPVIPQYLPLPAALGVPLISQVEDSNDTVVGLNDVGQRLHRNLVGTKLVEENSNQ